MLRNIIYEPVLKDNLLVLAAYYRDYCRELDKYSSTDMADADTENYLRQFIDDEHIYMFLIRENNHTVGFVIYSNFPQSLSKNSVFIQELYIIKEFRRMGYATEVIKTIASNNPEKDFCMHILKRNISALKFWENTMAELGYVDSFEIGGITTSSINEECVFKYYAKRQ